MSEIKPFCYLKQTSSERNPPHGWAVHFGEGEVPLYTTAAIESLQAECERVRAQKGVAEGMIEHLTDLLGSAQSRLDAVREIYAGMDGFVPQTAPEAYCLRIIREMAHAAMAKEKHDDQ